MATTIEKFDSTGGFAVGKTVVVDELRNAKDLNTLEVKNSHYTDSSSTSYILRGLNTSTLDLDGLGTQITIPSNTMSFVTGHIMAVNDVGTVYSTKFETCKMCFPRNKISDNLLPWKQDYLKFSSPLSKSMKSNRSNNMTKIPHFCKTQNRVEGICKRCTHCLTA